MYLRVSNLKKSFSGNIVVDNVTFSVSKGSIVSLLGPSGCGKTTILRMIGGLESPDRGSIVIQDRKLFDGDQKVEVEPYKRKMGMVFQSYALWPHLNVYQNVSFPLEVQKSSKNETKDRVHGILELVGLIGLEKRLPAELSGGQQQRVALARALVMSPDVLLLDEPLSNLDAKLREQMRRELKEIQSRTEVTMVYVTHDRNEALELSHQLIILDKGKIIQMGTPDEVLKNPANEFVSFFLT